MSKGGGGDLDELPANLAALRDLTREAHGACKDLNRAIKEARDFADGLVKLVDAAADSARRAAHGAGVEQMRQFEEHIQAEMNRSAADLNAALERARDHIGKALMPKVASVDLGDDDVPTRLYLTFEGGLFDADPKGEKATVSPNGKVPPREALAAAMRAGRSMDELMLGIQQMRRQLDAEVRQYRAALRADP